MASPGVAIDENIAAAMGADMTERHWLELFGHAGQC
jgi:hypothetical protein